MNPVIVIPSYWAKTDAPMSSGETGVYDHVPPITKPVPELETCLGSLEKVRGVLRVVVLLVAEPGCEESARSRVDGICRMHSSLNPVVIGTYEAGLVRDVVERAAPRLDADAISLRGYGAIRNMGLAVAAVLGHDVVVFLDDDEVVLDDEFLVNAAYGLGSVTRQGLPIACKSGVYLNAQDSPYANVKRAKWSERYWSKRIEFNQWMHRALSGTRVSRSNILCGGCFVVAADAYSKVPFDPTISRGEDLDYLLNLRMSGYDVWFDNAWRVRHLPPDTPSRADRFLQNVYRWSYEIEKIKCANARVGLRKISADSLLPYPAPWLTDEAYRRIAHTALRRAIVGPERSTYLRILFSERRRARTWAASVSSSYFAFLTHWPRVMSTLWDNRLLAQRVLLTGVPRRIEEVRSK